MRPSLHDAWWRLATQPHPHSFTDALACHFLRAGSLAYRAAIGVRNAAFDRGWARRVRLPCRVISVGNLTVGGTGKTACVERVAAQLASQGRRVAVLSRGYGGRRDPYWVQWQEGRLRVSGLGSDTFGVRPLQGQDLPAPRHDARDDRSSARQAGGVADEPQLLAQHVAGLPVVVGARRDRAGRFACRTFGVDTVILDDGFQHRRLHRDCDLVLVHARTPFGGWDLLPRGPMREPLTALRRADIIVITKADEAMETLAALKERLRAVNPDAVLATAAHQPTSLRDGVSGSDLPLARLDGARVGLVSSIGDPAGFEATAGRLHATRLWHQAFADHHAYRPAEWLAVLAKAEADRADAILTTEKDWVRLERLARAHPPSRVPVWILGVAMTFLSGKEELYARLARLYAG